ncbi:glycosyltransferase WbuB [Haloarcula sp. CBA1130]|nr:MULTISPECIES: glycosyltransferase family 4 protein [unclassified Haloarcula]KAA9400042.1 glycosyltransferase WbuB [Haloarcula sp. CBA1129]KAA9404023.1 glycosyltransferase WbuB [Haloarcula sp. CBA1130]
MDDSTGSVLILTQYFPPETGAASARWAELSDRWSEEVPVTVITSAPDYPNGELDREYDNDWLHREQHGNIEVLYTKTVTSSSGNLLRRGLKFVWFMVMSAIVGLRYVSPSVVIATSPQPLTGLSAWLIARTKGARFVFEVRDLWPESILAVSDFDSRLVIRSLERTVTFLYQRSDVLVVVSEGFVEPILERGVDRSKITFHPNGIEIDRYRTDGETLPGTEPDGDVFTISYVGTIGRSHGLSVVLDAAAELEDVRFVLVGDGAERERLKARAEDLDNVVFTGQRPKEEVPSILAASDAALVHLKPRAVFETVIPSKLLEAMAAELPVILGVRGEAERILRDAGAGVVMEPGNRTQLVEAAERLRDNPQERATFGQAGREFVVEQFSWENISAAYMETILPSSGPAQS